MKQPEIVPESTTAYTADTATRFRYTVDPAQAFITVEPEHPSYATFTVEIANRSDGAMPCSMILLEIPIGADATSLTPYAGGITAKSLQADRWSIDDSTGDGSFRIRPIAPVTGLAPNEGISFELRGVFVNGVEGPTQIAITETTDQDRRLELAIAKLRSPLTLHFSVAPAVIAPDETCTLSWETTASVGCTLTTGTLATALRAGTPPAALGDVHLRAVTQLPPNGQLVETPPRTTTYTLTAHGDGPDVSEQVTVVVDNPALTRLSIDRETILAGEQATLTWETANATGVLLHPGPAKPLAPSGSIVLPAQDYTQTYQLIAVNGVHRSIPFAITVNVQEVTVDRLEQVPTPVAPTASTVHVVWATTSAVSCTMTPEQGGPLKPVGELDIAVRVDTPCALTADGQNGPARRHITLRPPGMYQAAVGPIRNLEEHVAVSTPQGVVVTAGNYGEEGPRTSNIYTFLLRDHASWHRVGAVKPPNDVPRVGARGVWFDDRIWLVGGRHHDDVWSSPDGLAWHQATASPGWGKRFGFACVAFRGAMWVLGGWRYLSGTPLNDVWRSTDGVEWTCVTPKAEWPPFAEVAVAVCRGEMWLVAGADRAECWHSADGAQWSAAPPPPWSPRRAPVVQTAGDFVYLIGGDVLTKPMTDIWRMDATGAWLPCPSPAPRLQYRTAASVAAAEHIVIVGESPDATGQVWYYIPE